MKLLSLFHSLFPFASCRAFAQKSTFVGQLLAWCQVNRNTDSVVTLQLRLKGLYQIKEVSSAFSMQICKACSNCSSERRSFPAVVAQALIQREAH